MRKQFGLWLIVVVLLSISFPAYGESIKVGVTPGPHEEIMEIVRDVAAKDGLTIEIVTFTDYVTPNLVLDSGDIDVNSFQHIPYLEQFNRDRGLNLTWIAPTIIFPMGVYSSKIESLDQLPKNGVIAIPNDPTNGGRALLLLQSAGLISLKEGVGAQATVYDIAQNPKGVRIVEMDAANLPRSLEDVHLAAINTNYAIEAGLNPVADSLFMENAESPWVNVLAVRVEDKDKPVFKQLIKAYHSREVLEFVEEKYEGSLVPGFDLD